MLFPVPFRKISVEASIYRRLEVMVYRRISASMLFVDDESLLFLAFSDHEGDHLTRGTFRIISSVRRIWHKIYEKLGSLASFSSSSMVGKENLRLVDCTSAGGAEPEVLIVPCPAILVAPRVGLKVDGRWRDCAEDVVVVGRRYEVDLE